MHGVFNRAIEHFVRANYGDGLWQAVGVRAGIGATSFEPLLVYDEAVTEAVIEATCAHLGRDRHGLLEDVGTFLVTGGHEFSLRRLLRFGGDSFVEFLHSLDDIDERARLALPGLDLPRLGVRREKTDLYVLGFSWNRPGFGAVFAGILRAMADDYGALVLITHHAPESDGGGEKIVVELLEHRFSDARVFALGEPAS